ncbi:MAG: oligopeptide transporter, OPT family [Pirellulales bacterium]|nr:oligopeptide transporter, OPT family [Pirellulales bacterium]
MSTDPNTGGKTPPGSEPKRFTPFVPEKTSLAEMTLRAVILGLIMTVILGAANAYLGLKAGMTIAATYPAAIIGMAVLRLFKGSILEENMARTIGSIGESIAAGAVFTIPAFLIAGCWSQFDTFDAWARSSALMIVGGFLGIFFVTLLRRIMVEDPELPFPESTAAAEIHKAGQRGLGAAVDLVWAMFIGAGVKLAAEAKLFTASKAFPIPIPKSVLGFDIKAKLATLMPGKVSAALNTGGITTFQMPAISPAYLGVGFIIGPELGAMNFAGGLLAWGLFIPLLIYFMGPEISAQIAASGAEVKDADLVTAVWVSIVKPIAVGGMLVGAATTLFKMRKNLSGGMARAVRDLKASATAAAATGRLDRDMSMKVVFGGLAVVFLAMIAVYFWFSGNVAAAAVAAVVMAITGFFFAAVSGNLVGLIGSSNNPISGLTLCTLLVAALLMVAIGVSGPSGVAAVLGVAAVVCVSSAVAGEMLQDLKVGHLLGGTPSKMQWGDILGIVIAGSVMFFPLLILQQANIQTGGTGFGDKDLSAPQAGLMAQLASGIVGGNTPWPLIIVGVLMGLGFVLLKVRSPMLVSVGMYLPLETTFAIFCGGIIRWLCDKIAERRRLNAAQRTRTDNAGVLVASGLIAGEALMGLVVAGYIFLANATAFPGVDIGTVANGIAPFVLAGLAIYMIARPLTLAGAPDEPPPPSAVM